MGTDRAALIAPRIIAGILLVVLGGACQKGSVGTRDAGWSPAVDATDTPASVEASVDAGSGAAEMRLTDDENAARAMTMLEDVAALVQASKGDCALMGEKLGDYYSRNAAFAEEAKSAYETMPQKERRPIQVRYRARFRAVWKRLRPGLQKCQKQPQVSHVLDELLGK